MAIIKRVPGIEAVVVIKGEKVQEYKYNGTRSSKQVGRYIESIDDAEFAIRILVNDEYKFGKVGDDGLGIKVFVDGEYRCSTVWRMDSPITYKYLHGTRVPKEGGGSRLLAFKFKKIKTVSGEGEEHERELAAQQKEDTKDTGEIAVLFSRVKVKEEKSGLVADGGKTTETPHSELLFKVNHARKLTHGTG